jgi:hypothetical protein
MRDVPFILLNLYGNFEMNCSHSGSMLAQGLIIQILLLAVA